MTSVAEILLVAGPPGGGKSTFVQPYVDAGYFRINRDTVGGSLKHGGQAYGALRKAFNQGQRSFVCDNVYGTVESRAVILQVGHELGLPVRLVWLDTTPEQAQFFAARRQVLKYGKLFKAEDYKEYRKDPNAFPPGAQFAYWGNRVLPTMGEGFTAIEHVPVEIALGPEYVNRAFIFDFDGTLRVTKSGKKYPTHPDDVIVLPRRAEKIADIVWKGILVLGASNQSGISKKPEEEGYVSEKDAVACFGRTTELLGLQSMDYLYAPDRGGVPQTFWRKPFCGMGVIFIEKYKLDPKQVTVVGDLTSDETFASRCGFQFEEAATFFGD